MKINKKCFFVILTISLLLWRSFDLAKANDNGYKIVDSSKVSDILSMLASTVKSNYEKIKTWDGQISEDSMITIKGETAKRLLKESTNFVSDDSINEIQRYSSAKTDFKINIAKNQLLSISNYTEPYIYKEPEKEKCFTSKSLPNERIYISTPEHQTQIFPYTKTKDNITLSRIGIKEKPGRTISTNDPRIAFNMGGKTLWLLLSQFSLSLQIPDIEHYGVVIKEKSNGKKIIYRVEISDPNENWPFTLFELNSETGFNYTYVENWFDKNSLLSKIVTEFVELNGTFLPKKWKVSHYSSEGRLEREENFTVEKQQINKPVPENTFSERTYLKDGDKLRDEITKRQYTYIDKQFVEDKKKDNTEKN